MRRSSLNPFALIRKVEILGNTLTPFGVGDLLSALDQLSFYNLHAFFLLSFCGID